MNRKNMLLALGALILTAFGASQAQAKPNFTGDWTLNATKSDFGPMPAPDKMTMKVDHKDPAMNVSQTQSGPQGEMSYDSKYSTDGTETTNTFGPMEAKSTAKWEGDVLVVNTKLNAQGTEISIVSRWALSEDGKTITQSAHLNSPQGEIDLKYVLDKK